MEILIISEPFFGYANRIKDFLINQKHAVDLKFQFVPSVKDRLKRQIFKREFDQAHYYENLLDPKKNYDFILVINGKNIPITVIEKMTSYYKNSRKILYIWDDFKNLEQNRTFYDFFDIKYTYSKFDAEENKDLFFLPFFYSHGSTNKIRDIDVSFVGSMHSDRYQKLRQIKNANQKLKYFYYIYADFITYAKYFTKIKFTDVNFSVMSYDNYIKTLSKSKAVIELPHPTQKNITTRAIEVLGTRTKLITTSHAVKNYEFYHPDNVFIINDKNLPEISDWLNITFNENSSEILKKYSLQNWVDNILS